jgi:hypothetical protein
MEPPLPPLPPLDPVPPLDRPKGDLVSKVTKQSGMGVKQEIGTKMKHNGQGKTMQRGALHYASFSRICLAQNGGQTHAFLQIHHCRLSEEPHKTSNLMFPQGLIAQIGVICLNVSYCRLRRLGCRAPI